jgi:hypothetical protein
VSALHVYMGRSGSNTEEEEEEGENGTHSEATRPTPLHECHTNHSTTKHGTMEQCTWVQLGGLHRDEVRGVGLEVNDVRHICNVPK